MKRYMIKGKDFVHEISADFFEIGAESGVLYLCTGLPMHNVKERAYNPNKWETIEVMRGEE